MKKTTILSPGNKQIRAVFEQAAYTSLALNDGNESYILSLYYGLHPQNLILYFMVEPIGEKMDYLKSNPFVCGTVVLPSCSPERKKLCSVVYKGLVEVLFEKEEKQMALNCLKKRHALSSPAELDFKKDKWLLKLRVEESSVR